jgi:hypothetical protein
LQELTAAVAALEMRFDARLVGRNAIPVMIEHEVLLEIFARDSLTHKTLS